MEKKRAVHAIIFDLDGTLVNSLPDITAAVNHVLRIRGLPERSRDQVRTFVGDGLAKLLTRALGRDDPDLIQSASKDFAPYYDAHCMDETACYEGVPELLRRFSNKKLAVVSNKPEAFTKKILAGLKLARYFQAVIGPESVRRQKPDPESCLKISADFSIPPEKFCCVGDRRTDIDAGRAAKMFTAGVTAGYGSEADLKASGPDILIPRTADLEKYIE